MRQKNMRVMLTGAALAALAILFFLYFLSIASKSTNPRELMSTVGAVSGVCVAIGLVMVVFGEIGKQR